MTVENGNDGQSLLPPAPIRESGLTHGSAQMQEVCCCCGYIESDCICDELHLDGDDEVFS